ncbi:hypothetical protein PHYC_03012 [Phycisphaerales bacterium]|nr:hypothetical protein PHYC_03012 [Phycisphaerales bacterium]
MRTIATCLSLLVLALCFGGCAAHRDRQVHRASMTLLENFPAIDSDNNGQLSKEELNAAR